MYPVELVFKDTTDSPTSASYRDLEHGVVNCTFFVSNIPSSPVYGVYMWQLIRYSRTCNSYWGFSTSVCPVNKEASQSRFHKN